MAIPKIIHQTWKNKHPHAALAACIESFRFLNPGWDLRFYTDDECVNWVRKHCPQFLQTYKSYKTGIHRADFFRILVLYFEGGVYADIDVECIRPLDELIAKLDPSKSVYLTRDHAVHERVHFHGRPMWMNDFMIAEPGDPLIGEILRWMLHSVPSSTSASAAVLETGPGVVSAVIEMHGGPDYVPSLGILPTPWIHPLPDMNCAFDEKAFYSQMIASRLWLAREVYVVHYWFHTWVKGVMNNTLTDSADVLLSTLGEQVERKLQWLLGPEPAGRDITIACALAEFAETRGHVVLYIHEAEDPFMDRFLELLRLSGLRPRMHVLVSAKAKNAGSRVEELEFLGAERLRSAEALARLDATGWAGKTLVVCSPHVQLSEEALQREFPDLDGFLLGPCVEAGHVVTNQDGVCLTEMTPRSKIVPRVVHLLPNHGMDVQDVAAALAEHEFSVRHWDAPDIEQVVSEAALGTWDMSMLSEQEICTAGALAILYIHGGAMFSGKVEDVAAKLSEARRQTFAQGEKGWLIACPPRSDLLKGTLRQWLGARRRDYGDPSLSLAKASQSGTGRVGVMLPEFLRTRLEFLHKSGQLEDLRASRLKSHEFSL